MNNIGDERVITKTFDIPTSIKGEVVCGTVTVKQRLMYTGEKVVLGKPIQQTRWVDVEVIK